MKKLNILIIEDDLIYASKLKDCLSNYSKNIFLETNSEKGAQCADENIPDVIFLDNYLPGVHGKDSIELFKNVICPNAILILMSACFTEDDRRKGHERGADLTLDKNDLNKALIKDILDKVI